jgi:COP9 signalosome complex subunit 5
MNKAGEEQMGKIVKSAEKIANEEKMGLMAAMVKEKVFAASAPQVAQMAKVAEVNGADTQMTDAKSA